MGAAAGHILRALCIAVLCLASIAGGAAAQDVAGLAERTIKTLRSELDRIQTEIQRPTVSDQQLTENRHDLEDARTQALLQSENLAAPIDDITQQIARLGAAPGPTQTEAPDIASQRSALQDSLNRLQSARKQLEVIAIEAEQLSGRVESIQRDQFFARIFERSKSILNPGLWYDTVVGIGLLGQRLGALFTGWWSEVGGGANFLGLLIIPASFAALAFVYFAFRQRVRQWFDASFLASRSPDEVDRLWRVARGVIAVALLVQAVKLPVVLGLQVSGMMTSRLNLLVTAVAAVVGETAIKATLARRLAAPGLPLWRIIGLSETNAVRFPYLFSIAAFVSALTGQLQTLTDSLYLPVTNTIGQSAISATVMLVLLALILPTLGHEDEDGSALRERPRYFGWAVRFVPLVWLSLAVAAVALLLGFISLASFIVHQIFDTAVLVAVLFLLHHLSDAAVASGLDPASAFGRFLRRVGGFTDHGIERLGIFFRTVADLLLIIVGLPLLFLQWTVTWIDFRSIINTAFFGFKVGNVTVSLGTLLMVILIVGAGVAVTNLVVRWLDVRILAGSRLNKGVQDSLKKGGSYVGYTLAALFALTAAGLNFSNLALIAGALGVGIGFGLQSIVNNFVSGLILLAERPIRAGDWVSLAVGEGLVKRINVRATVIETFDKCTIIVPNSLLVAEPVRNWTYGDGAGRLTITVTAEYGSDPETICKMLTDIANAHRAIMSDPPANALFAGFGDIGMKFELKAYVADVFEAVFVASELRISIDKAFKQAGIRIPSTAPPVPKIVPPKL